MRASLGRMKGSNLKVEGRAKICKSCGLFFFSSFFYFKYTFLDERTACQHERVFVQAAPGEDKAPIYTA